jgi:phosphoglucomutase
VYEQECCFAWAQVIDEVEDYLKLLRSIYNFKALSELLRRPDFSFVFDGMHGVAGPYAKRIFVQARALCHVPASPCACTPLYACHSLPGREAAGLAPAEILTAGAQLAACAAVGWGL